MRIVVVSHEADFTGAPRVAFDIASVLARDHNVSLVSKRDGPLIKLPKYENLRANYFVADKSADLGLSPFSARMRHAIAVLKKLRPALVYANSAASFEWCVAARRLRIPCVMHVHEMTQTLRSLLALDVLKIDFLKYVDLLVSASQEASDAILSLTHDTVSRHFMFGVAIETDYIKSMSAADAPPPMNVAGRELSGDRPIVAMCGVATARKGFDIFYESAKALPEADFLWIGPLFHDSTVSKVMQHYQTDRIENFYVTGETANPYPYMSMCDIFALTSVEDPNPLVVPEALTLGRRVVSFHNSGGSWQWTRRFGYSLSGTISTNRLTAFLHKMLELECENRWSERQAAELREAVDIDVKLPSLRHELSELVGEAV
jgi:hypothetical protein